MKNLALFLSAFLFAYYANASSYEFRPMMVDSYMKPYTFSDYEAQLKSTEGGVNPVAVVSTVVGVAGISTIGGLYLKNVSDKNNMEACVSKTRDNSSTYYVYSAKSEDEKDQEFGMCVTCCATGYLRIYEAGVINCVASFGQTTGTVSPNPLVCLEYENQMKKINQKLPF